MSASLQMVTEFTDTNAHLIEAEDGRWDLYDFLTAYGHRPGAGRRGPDALAADETDPAADITHD